MQKNLIIGNGKIGSELAAAIIKNSGDISALSGFVCDNQESHIDVKVDNRTEKIPVLGAPSQLSAAFFENLKLKSPNLILTLEEERDADILRRLSECIRSGIQIQEGNALYESMTGRIPVKHINEKWLIHGLSKPDKFYSFYKRLFDVFLSSFALLFLSPLFLVIGLLIKIDSKGPVFYRQYRIGKNGKRFIINKFRTMVNNADKMGEHWTVEGDKRISRVGKILRKLRIDELPQLWNVLKGDMSLVGPRPEAHSLVEDFEKDIPFYGYRYSALPGITGWAQVNHPNTSSVAGALEKLQYDLYGIKHASFLFDLKILFKTIWVVLSGKGAR